MKRSSKRTATSWDPVKSLYGRALGREDGFLFRDKANASKQLVKRLDNSHQLKFHTGCVNSLNFDQSGDLIVSGSDDLKIVVWDWMNSCEHPKVHYDSGHTSNVFQVLKLIVSTFSLIDSWKPGMQFCLSLWFSIRSY